jgi:site-specific DNA recombinase
MPKNDDRIAIYSRKSKFTGKGESIGNQVELCKEYIRLHYGEEVAESILIFEDKGFSGGNLNRPDFKRMMNAANQHKFKAVVVYRLDWALFQENFTSEMRQAPVSSGEQAFCWK